MQLIGALRAVPEGVTIRIEVSPGSRYSGVSGYNPWRQTICIKLTERPQMGKANEQLVKYLALLFNKPVDDVQLISGHTSTRKWSYCAILSLTKLSRLLTQRCQDSFIKKNRIVKLVVIHR